MKVKFCKDCKWSRYVSTAKCMRCVNPYVLSHDYQALASSATFIDDEQVEFEYGTACWEERSKRWFSPCGMKGKRFEQRVDIPKWIQEKFAKDLR